MSLQFRDIISTIIDFVFNLWYLQEFSLIKKTCKKYSYKKSSFVFKSPFKAVSFKILR